MIPQFGSYPGFNSQFECRLGGVPLAAAREGALVGVLPRVHHHVDLEGGRALALPAADVAHDVRPLLRRRRPRPRPLPPPRLRRVGGLGIHGALTEREIEDMYRIHRITDNATVFKSLIVA